MTTRIKLLFLFILPLFAFAQKTGAHVYTLDLVNVVDDRVRVTVDATKIDSQEQYDAVKKQLEDGKRKPTSHAIILFRWDKKGHIKIAEDTSLL